MDLWDTQFFLFIRLEESSITGELRRILTTTNVFLYKFDISQGYHHTDINHNYDQGYALSCKNFGESKG